MTDLTRMFDPVGLPAGSGNEWGHRAASILRPQTMFADRLAHAIERAWDAVNLAAEVLIDPRPEMAGPVARRANELSIDLEWVTNNLPDDIHPDDVPFVLEGMELVTIGTSDVVEAFPLTLLELDDQIRMSLPSVTPVRAVERDYIRELRDNWAENLDNLGEGNSDFTRALAQRMRETVDILDEVLAA